MRVSLCSVAGFAGTSVSHAVVDSSSAATPGLYYLDFCDAEGAPTSTSFFVDPVHEERGEVVLRAGASRKLHRGRFLPLTLKLWRMPGEIPLYEERDYTVDWTTGMVSLLQEIEPSDLLIADYRYPGATTGPWPLDALHAIPGVVLAFGHVLAGDRVAVLVEHDT